MNSEKTASKLPHQAEREPTPPLFFHNQSDHLVQFYEEDGYLLDSVGAFLEAGFKVGEGALVIATPDHREKLERLLADRGLATTALEAEGRLAFLDAEETLGWFLVDGWPDEGRFREVVGGMLNRCLQNRPGLRAFGEMVALLWARGQRAAALRLEDLWNSMGRTYRFSLFCAYPMAGFRGGDNAESLQHVCRTHSRVIPPESNSPEFGKEGGPRQSYSPLDRQAASLEADASERRGAEEASRRLAAIVESSFDGIISKNLDGVITSWNHAAERIFGYTAEEMVGKPVSTLIPPHLMGDEVRILSRIRGGERVEPFETVRVHKDGHTLDVSLTVSPVRDGTGKIIGASKIVRDITEQKKSAAALVEKEEQLRQAHKMEAVGRLAGGIAHDFNNLLTAINGYSEMSLTLVKDGELLHEYLQEIRKSGERAASLTQQLLAYSRKQILSPTIFNLNATVADMDRMLRRLIGEDIEIETALDPGLGLVKADPGQVQQIILNLVLNARDAMPNGGRLTLATANRVLDAGHRDSQLEAAPGPHVMLSVTDTGTGMDEKVKARIFEPFFTTKEVGKGTGLGLSSVYGILKQSGGSIQVDSEPGKGSCFRIFLPLTKPAEGGAAADRRPAKDGLVRRSETILLVEDEETVRRFVARSLAALGFNLLEAKDGAAALALGEKQTSIDLLITDVVMPNMNGSKLAEKLKALHPDLKVIFMSGYPDNVLLPLGLPEHKSRFLQKPFGQAQVSHLVQEFLDEGKSARSARG